MQTVLKSQQHWGERKVFEAPQVFIFVGIFAFSDGRSMGSGMMQGEDNCRAKAGKLIIANVAFSRREAEILINARNKSQHLTDSASLSWLGKNNDDQIFLLPLLICIHFLFIYKRKSLQSVGGGK